jgi:F-type H+-transporting ATPase subunit b
MITIDLTMPIQIINMLLLIVILNAILYRPIRNILEERKKKLTGLDGDVTNFKKNAQLRLEEFEQKIMEARIRAKSEYDTARNAAQAQSSEKLAGIRKEVDAQKAEQLSRLEKEFAAAQQELKGQIGGFAGEMAVKVLGRAI